jgi:hypothetical protein
MGCTVSSAAQVSVMLKAPAVVETWNTPYVPPPGSPSVPPTSCEIPCASVTTALTTSCSLGVRVVTLVLSVRMIGPTAPDELLELDVEELVALVELDVEELVPLLELDVDVDVEELDVWPELEVEELIGAPPDPPGLDVLCVPPEPDEPEGPSLGEELHATATATRTRGMQKKRKGETRMARVLREGVCQPRPQRSCHVET